MIATLANMKRIKDPQVFAYSPSTGEECSANSDDYFWLVGDTPLTDETGEPMILVRRVNLLEEIEDEPSTPLVPYETVRQIADEQSERVRQALQYIENTDAHTDELGMVEDILRGLVDLGWDKEALQ